jgi:hypothetical protein
MVMRAYHTEIHTLSLNGETHFANMSDPQTPAALEPVVTGVVSLHNFRPTPKAALVTNYTISGTFHPLVAGDLDDL